MGGSIHQMVEHLVEHWGYVGIATAMLLDPPFPSELVMPLAGFYVGQGKLNVLMAVAAGLLGTLVGALPWYAAGRMLNEERLEHWIHRYGRWLGISSRHLAHSRQWFRRHGTAVVFWGRLLPGVRVLISVPAGVEMMPIRSFLFWTTAGSLIWIAGLTAAGWALGSHWQQVLIAIEPLVGIIYRVLLLAFLAALAWIVVRAWRRRPSAR
jgi:membrane protein DedA with SNARE-associated domain